MDDVFAKLYDRLDKRRLSHTCRTRLEVKLWRNRSWDHTRSSSNQHLESSHRLATGRKWPSTRHDDTGHNQLRGSTLDARHRISVFVAARNYSLACSIVTGFIVGQSERTRRSRFRTARHRGARYGRLIGTWGWSLRGGFRRRVALLATSW